MNAKTSKTEKNRTAVNAKMSVFVICVKSIIYLLLYNSHDCNFKYVQALNF